MLHRIRTLLLAGFLFLPAVALAQAVDLSTDDRVAIRQIITRQIDAFRRDAGEEAFAYAAPGIRATFMSADIFMAMVQSAYQAVYRPRSVQFEEIIDFYGRPAQRVHLIGPDGIPVIAVYPMERQPDGSWLIAGCYLIPTDARST
ncbi:MAG: DUF4864 domain-containing protein [Alphaproteobacteria bacterium]|nr:DUF4864 domain-containing protein [Alphaproteobacteria bacterium]